MKVLATGPLVGCAGADPTGSLPGDSGGTSGASAIDGSGLSGSSVSSGGGTVGSAGKASSNGGSVASSGGSVASGGSAASSGGSAFVSDGGTSSAGNAFVSSGNTGGGSFASGGTSTGASGAATAGTTGTTGTTAGAAGSAPADFSHVAAGNVSAISVGQLIVVAGIFLMGRDAKGIYVMSMQCTHKGCALVFSGAQLDCPCHHSRFDANGNVLVGPATTALPHLALTVDGAGNITVDRYTVVPQSTRTPV